MYVSSDIYDDVHLSIAGTRRNVVFFAQHVIIGEVQESCVMTKVTGDS